MEDERIRSFTAELKAFIKGFRTYSHLESPTQIPIAVWVFKFPDPHGTLDSVFNAKAVPKDLIEKYLDIGERGIRNGLTVILLDRQIVKAIKLVALNPEAVKMLHGTIRKQLGMDYRKVDYEACLGDLFTRTTMELYEMGRQFQYG